MSPILQTDVPLRALNTFGIDARARQLIEIRQADDIDPALAILRNIAREPLVLGGGSNLLFRAPWVERPVIRMCLHGLRRLAGGVGGAPGVAIVEAAAGEPWDPFVRWTLEQGLCGLENLALIPGTVGAAPIQNIGAYGVELRECFDSLDAVHVQSGERRRFDAAECQFGYRDSFFKRAEGSGWIILAVRLRLSTVASLRLDYGEIREQLRNDNIDSPTPVHVAHAVSSIRQRKLPDPDVIGNAGSFFKNPIIAPAQAAALRDRESGLPTWPAGDLTKLSAAWMIERCGWKGFRDGDAGVHDQHALVLVNHGAASGAALLGLAQKIVDSVEARFGVRLEPEPKIA